jgi:hypothetical protein
MLNVVGTDSARDDADGRSLLDEIAREGARRMLVAALETGSPRTWRRIARNAMTPATPWSRAAVKGRTRKVTVGAGTIPVSAPRVCERPMN